MKAFLGSSSNHTGRWFSVLGLALASVLVVAACGQAAPAPSTPAGAQKPAATTSAPVPAATASVASPAANKSSSTPAANAPSAKTTIRLAHAGSETHQWQVWSVNFKDQVEKASNGAIQVQIFPNAQLGKEADLAQGVQLGQIEMAAVGVPISQWIPSVAITDMPFLFRDRQHAYKALDGYLGEELNKKATAAGFDLIGWVELGWRDMTSNKGPVNKATDMNGWKMRVPNSKVYIEMMKALGATVVPVDFSELYLALQQNLVDGEENPVSTIKAQSFFEVQKYLSLTHHMLSTTYVVVSPRWLGGLDAGTRDVVTKAAKAATDYQRKFVADDDEKTLVFLKEKGMQVNTPSDPQSFRDATKNVPGAVSDIVPAEWVTRVQEIR